MFEGIRPIHQSWRGLEQYLKPVVPPDFCPYLEIHPVNFVDQNGQIKTRERGRLLCSNPQTQDIEPECKLAFTFVYLRRTILGRLLDRLGLYTEKVEVIAQCDRYEDGPCFRTPPHSIQ